MFKGRAHGATARLGFHLLCHADLFLADQTVQRTALALSLILAKGGRRTAPSTAPKVWRTV